MRLSLQILWPCNGPLILSGREDRNTERSPDILRSPAFSQSLHTRYTLPRTKTTRSAATLRRLPNLLYFLGARLRGALINITRNKGLGGPIVTSDTVDSFSLFLSP